MKIISQSSDHNSAPRKSFVTDSSQTPLVTRMTGGRDTLVADLFWTFHGENASRFADVTLVSSDDRQFPCCRGILAARSSFFAKLLFPENGRNPSPIVGVALPGDVLDVVLHYLHTGDIRTDPVVDRPALDKLLAVARAAHEMAHDAMLADCVRHLLNMVNDNLLMLCPVLEAFYGERPFADIDHLLESLLLHVRKSPAASLLVPELFGAGDDMRLPLAASTTSVKQVGVLELSRRALETLVVKDKRADSPGEKLHDEYWFYVSWYWAVHSTPAPPNASSSEPANGGTIIVNGATNANVNAANASPDTSDLKGSLPENDERRMHATQIINLLDPSRMRAEFLLRVVEPTSLMALQKLCDGYKAHATKGLRSLDPSRKRLRFLNRLEKRHS